ncbi:DNA-binding response regulator [Phaeocystidibacter marisrubri]|nr:DNA-binding response regulator [Phaeocystidibacter marisrubri]
MKAIVEMDGSFDILAVCSSSEELFTTLEEVTPDIIVLDISLPDVDGFDIFARLRTFHPQVKTIIYTMHRVRRYMDHFHQNGANGYVLKSGELGELVDALKQVYNGERYFPESVTGIKHVDDDYEDNQIQLTETEKLTLRALNINRSNKEIAETLDVSINEVIDIRKSLLFKSNAVNTRELLEYAKRKKWI